MKMFSTPPPMSFFSDPRPARGERSIHIALGDVELLLRGLDDDLHGELLQRYERFIGSGAPGEGGLLVDVEREDREFFAAKPSKPELNLVRLACEGQRVRYLSYQGAGWFDTRGGQGRLLTAHGTYEPHWRTLENYIRASIAWNAAERGGALVHAASAVWRGRGYLFYGESGAGKSTLSECNRRARVVSDDLSLVLLGADGSPELIGSPFRGTYEGGEPVYGRFPIVAGFRIIQDERAEVRQVNRVRAMAELVGNLPFVAEAYSARPDLFARIEQVFGGIPLAHLHFRKDESYWDAIEQAGY